MEFAENENTLQAAERIEERLIFGGYPQVVLAKTREKKNLNLESIRDGYLLKDILALDNIKDSLFVLGLLRQIAFQIGHDVSHNELAQNLNTNPRTVERYLELLEKTFVLFSRYGYSRNLRKEYTKTPRYYFWDSGIRNIVISNLNDLALRDDVGALWENYCVSERAKRNKYKNFLANSFYWRTYDQKEIDLVEERGGKLHGYEMKWGKTKIKKPQEFLDVYPGSTWEIVNKDNCLKFIT
jgi:predicted AAA+ superfamily ATPase